MFSRSTIFIGRCAAAALLFAMACGTMKSNASARFIVIIMSFHSSILDAEVELRVGRDPQVHSRRRGRLSHDGNDQLVAGDLQLAIVRLCHRPMGGDPAPRGWFLGGRAGPRREA